MREETKHKIASSIYKSFSIIKGIGKAIWKPILVGGIWFGLCVLIVEFCDISFIFSDEKEFVIIAYIGAFLPITIVILKYLYKGIIMAREYSFFPVNQEFFQLKIASGMLKIARQPIMTRKAAVSDCFMRFLGQVLYHCQKLFSKVHPISLYV